MTKMYRYLFTALAAMCLTGCDETFTDSDFDLFDEDRLLQHDTPSMEIRSISFSPDSKTFTVATRMLHDIGPYPLTDSSVVRIEAKESVNGIPQHKMLPVLTAARNTEADRVTASNIKMQVLVDLTLPQESIDRQYRAINEMLTCFNPDNLYVSFMYGDSVTVSVKATDYVMNHYFLRKPDNYKYLYSSILMKKQEMEEQQEPWNNASAKLLVVFSDEQVYQDDDHPMDPGHYVLQEELLQSSFNTDEKVVIYYVSMNIDEDREDEHAASILKIFCKNHHGLYLPKFNWVSIKNSFFEQYHLDINDNEFDFINPDFKIYRGNHHVLTLDFYTTSNDSLIASASTQIHKGSIYEPVIVRGHGIWYVILQGFLFGLMLMFLVYLIFQYLIPFIKYRLFLKNHVVTYTGPMMSVENKMVSQSCYLCKAPFEEGDKVVVKCEHTIHKDCWDENEYHCPEYGHQCKTGSHYYNKSCLYDLRNASYYMWWILVAMVAAIVAWIVFSLRIHYTSTHILEVLLRHLPFISDNLTAGVKTDINEFAEHDKCLSAFGLAIGFFLTLGFSALALYRRSVRKKWFGILTRATIAGLGCMVCFLIIGAIEAIFDIDSFAFLIEWIPWTLSAFIIAYVATARTRIHLKRRMLLLAVAIALITMFVWSFLILGSRLDFRVLLLLSYLIFAIGLAVCIAEPLSKSKRYFLRIEGPVKTIEIALYKWFDASPRESITIGKSVNCNLQMSWDTMGAIAPTQAEIRSDGINIWLYAVENGIYIHNKPLEAGESVQLYHESQFLIGKTTFTYLEKDL